MKTGSDDAAAAAYVLVREHIVGISKSTYVLTTSRCLDWRRDLQRTSTASSRTRSTILLAMAVVIAAIIGALGERGDAMSRKLRPLAALALSAMVALISACGSNAPAATGSGGSGGGNTAANVEKAVKFAECMRDNGVSEFPDPNASGDFAYGIKAGSSLDPSTAAWQQAIGACKDLEPAGFMPKTLTTQEIDARLKFARCIRENGVPDFPDPTDNGPLIVVPHAQSNTELQAALQKCRHLMAAALGGQ
jgi:hypothetical protein